MTDLTDKLDEVDRDELVDDVVDVIDREVADKGGLTGTALKAGYSAVKKMENGRMIEKAVDELLDEFTDALSPLYTDYAESDTTRSFEAYLDRHPDEAVEALLGVTDEKAEEADNQFLKSTYEKLRGSAESHVEAALPRVGRLVDEHAPVE